MCVCVCISVKARVCRKNFFEFFVALYLPVGWIGGYGGGGLIHVPSGLLMCRRSDENSAKYCSAGITRKNLSAQRRSNPDDT